MTQAFNLSQLANRVNTSGQIDAATALYNQVSVANGGTGLSSLNTNSLMVGNGSAVGFIAPGANEQVLTSNGTTWQAANVSSIGVGQTWQSPSRAYGTTYTNTTGKPIAVNICVVAPTTTGYASVTVGGLIIGYLGVTAANLYSYSFNLNIGFIVPNNTSYILNVVTGTTPTLSTWAELR